MNVKDGALPDRPTLVDRACTLAGLADFGDLWFFENIDALIPSLNAEARLTAAGTAGAAAMIVNALVNRLRHVDLLKRHPEILEETIDVAAVIVGLPRTGSTLIHRLLASAPGMTGVLWFEAQNYAPFPDEARGETHARRQAAQGILDHMLEKLPELMSMHPMSVDQPDEEVIVLGQLFSSTMIEATYFVPGFSTWLGSRDRVRPYRDLREVLQALQWHDPARESVRWVLKTPGHLMALDAVTQVFPEAKIVMTHRDPLATVPSFCSFAHALYRLNATVDRETTARFWVARLAALLNDFMAARNRGAAERFVDIRYENLTANPVAEVSTVLEAVGVKVSSEIRAALAKWVEANRREARAPHRYSAREFGLKETEIAACFAAYRAAWGFRDQ